MCHKTCRQLQPLDVAVPQWMEAMFFRVVLTPDCAFLLSAHSYSRWQGCAPLDFLTDHINGLPNTHNCQHAMVVGDLNYHLVGRTYEDFLDAQGLVNHVDFPTHVLGGFLDSVLSHPEGDVVTCTQLG